MGLFLFLIFSPLVYLYEIIYANEKRKYKQWLADIISEAMGVC